MMQGRLKECVKHFICRFPDEPILRKQLLDYLGLKTWDTIVRWKRDANFPVGEVDIKISHLLDALGYRVAELEVMSSRARSAAQLVAFDIVPFEELVSLHALNRQTMFSILRGVSGTTELHEKMFAEMAGKFVEAVATKKRELQKFAVADNNAEQAGNGSVAPKVAAATAASAPIAGRDPVGDFALYVQVMTPLATALVSDRFTPADRARLRELVGDDGMLKLTNLCAQLCGEQARDKFQNNLKKGGRSDVAART